MELWVEKYRQTTLEEYVGNETIKGFRLCFYVFIELF